MDVMLVSGPQLMAAMGRVPMRHTMRLWISSQMKNARYTHMPARLLVQTVVYQMPRASECLSWLKSVAVASSVSCLQTCRCSSRDDVGGNREEYYKWNPRTNIGRGAGDNISLNPV